MSLFLALFLFFFFLPFTAWAYFDPGFGGYLVNSILSWAVTGLAFVSAAIIYFFRTIIGQRLFSLFKRHEKTCLIVFLSVLGMGSFFLGAFLRHAWQKPSMDHSHFSGARIIDPKRMCKGYYLYAGKLIDDKGKIIHQWSPSSFGSIDKNGDYYAGPEGLDQDQKDPSWGRYTWDNKVIWKKHFFIHHELYLSPQGTIFTFTNEIQNYNNYKVDFDDIVEFDKNGKELQRFSFWDHLNEFQSYHAKFRIDVAPFSFITLFWKNFLEDHQKDPDFDYFHLNSFFVIPPNALENKDQAFRPGNWLISMRHGSMVFILDQDTQKILWHAVAKEIEGSLDGQHSASMLPDGNILLFDNGPTRRASRVLIIDPLTLKIKWEYKNTDLFSADQGFVQVLPNGNFLVTESMKGHAFELTPDKKIVWDYHDLDTSIYRMSFYPQEMIDPLFRKGGS